MTREEQIEEFIEFNAHKFSVRYGYETIEELMREMAQWCDNNPKSPWISVEERLPKIGDMIVLGYERREIGWFLIKTDEMTLRKMRHKKEFGITHWMPIPQIKKGE